MENKKYKVCRDDIYVGEVIKTNIIYRYEGPNKYCHIKNGQLNTIVYKTFRSILFVPNEYKLANDLLYNSPNYPILNVTDDNTCMSLGSSSIVVHNACNLASLLKHFNYQKELTYDDILKIRKSFFNGKFIRNNIDDSKLFVYFDILDKMGDLSFKEAVMFHQRMNVFLPNKKEEKTKKLSLF